VTTPAAEQFAALLRASGAAVARDGARLDVTGMATSEIGELAAAHRIALHELTPQQASLEDAFLALTADSVQFAADWSAA
jgi:ABC-2 type transport system ATP-binding protein